MTKCNCPAATLLREIVEADERCDPGFPLDEVDPYMRRAFAIDAARLWLHEREAKEGEKK